MVTDIVEESGGKRFHVWGVTDEGASVLVRISDFQQYFFIAAPTVQVRKHACCDCLVCAVSCLNLRTDPP